MICIQERLIWSAVAISSVSIRIQRHRKRIFLHINFYQPVQYIRGCAGFTFEMLVDQALDFPGIFTVVTELGLETGGNVQKITFASFLGLNDECSAALQNIGLQLKGLQ